MVNFAPPKRPALARSIPGHSRRVSGLALLLHAVFFIAAATQTAIVPLLPELSRLHHLTPAATAFLIAAPGLATLAVTAPAGLIVDRLGAKRVTVLAVVLLSASGLAQAVPAYAGLVLGRIGFGFAYGIVWTTGVAWLAGVHRDAGTGRLGAVATSAAAGMAAGPGVGGLAGQWLGLAAPFVIVGGLAAVAAAMLWRQPGPRASSVVARESLRQMTRVAPRHPGVLAGACSLAIVGAVGGVTQLLVPIDLHRAGLSAAATGIAFSAASAVYILVSGTVVRLGGRLTKVRVAATAGLVLSLSLIPASLDATPIVLIAVLLFSTGPRAMVSTVAYPLATDSAAEAELPDGAVIGLLNGTWALGLVLAPVIAGAIDGAVSPGAAYLTAVLPGSLMAVWLLSRGGLRVRRPSPVLLRS